MSDAPESLVRTFVALIPSDEQGRAIAAAVHEAREADSTLRRRFRWTDPTTMHLTLAFLGDVPEGRLDDVVSACRDATRRHAPFRWSLHGVGAFPSVRRVRVVWAGVDEGRAAIEALANDVAEGLGAVGFPREARSFHAHVTLARVRGRPADAVPALAVATPPATVEALHVMRSELRPEGARHTEIARVPLGRDAEGLTLTLREASC